MAVYMYVSASAEDKIQIFTINPHTGGLTLHGEVAVPGSPSDIAVHPNRKFMYVVRKGIQAISTYSRNLKTGELALIGTLEAGLEPGYVATDRKGNFLLSTYFWVGKAAVHPIGRDGISPVRRWNFSIPPAASIPYRPTQQINMSTCPISRWWGRT